MEQEFTEQINNHIGILYKICNTYFYKNSNKEDYFQEILIRLWKAYPQFKNRSSFSTWMYRVALNTAIDIVRKISIQPRFIELSSKELDIPNKINQKDSSQKDRLYYAINQLNINEKAIALLYLDGYTYDEISDVIGVSKNNVGVKINRIKKEIIKILDNYGKG